MEISILLGSFLAVAIVLGIVITGVKRRLNHFSREVFGTPDILDALSDLELETEHIPRSLSGCDNLLLPQILKDFPDFDAVLAKTYARDYLKKQFGNNGDFTVYNIVIARYLSSAAQKTIVFQAAVSWIEQNRKVQKRYELNYAYILPQSDPSIAANCPNCGGALGYGVSVCPFCDSRVSNILGNTWRFTELREN